MTTATQTAAGRADERGAPQPSILGRLARAWADYARYRRTVGELETLSDRELADIGLSRADIADVAQRAAGPQR
jgi:uncharacterized protein YjiS (DUF1127 family)